MIYLDTSALVKLVVTEPETAALKRWLAERSGAPRVSSALARAELARAVRPAGDAALICARVLLGDLQQMPLNPTLLDAAGALPGRLRTLDAVHLASAERLRPALVALVAYDQRLLRAARETGLPVASPGAS